MRRGLDHPDWLKARRELDSSVPVLNRRAQRAFAWTCVAVMATWLVLLLAFPLTTTHVVSLCMALGAALGALTGAWPHDHSPRRHTTMRIAGGWLIYLAGRHLVNRAVERRREDRGGIR